MRIIGGSLKGKTLFYPKSRKIRPTQGLIRAALFNILGEKVSGARVSDLFCGAGSLGIEAISRGAQSVLFVDNDPEALRFLRRNLKGLAYKSRIKRGDVLEIISQISDEEFDIVFLDPPYGQGLAQTTVEKLVNKDLVAPRGMIVVEHSRREPILPSAGLSLFKERIYGDSRASILRRIQ